MSRHRGRHDPLQTVDRPMWIVEHDPCSQVTWQRRLEPRTDLKAALAAERQRLIQEGCIMDEVSWLSFVFGWRGMQRICLNIQPVEPGTPLIGHGTWLGVKAPGK